MRGYLAQRQLFLVGAGLIAGLVVAASVLPLGLAQQIHRNPFESGEVSWTRGTADTPFEVKQHVRTNQVQHDGQRSELIQINAGTGKSVNFQYALGKAPVSEELSIGVWIKANRPGMQLQARVVLPHERDPKSLDDAVTVVLKGDVYRLAGRWQRLELVQVVSLLKKAQQTMQAELSQAGTRRSVNIKDAYVDLLILNVYGGPGDNTVWIDDLEAGPVVEAVPVAQGKPGTTPGVGKLVGQQKPGAPTMAAVEFNGAQLFVGGKRFFLRAVRYSDTPLKVLRNAGFNALSVPHNAPPSVLREAAELGFLLVPSLPVVQGDKQMLPPSLLGQEVGRFPQLNNVLFWDMGNSLATEQAGSLAKSVQFVHAADPNRPVGADVWDGFLPYSRFLNVVGAHRWPLMTGLELSGYQRWLDQRRLLSGSGTYMWTWVQTHTPEFFTQLLYNQPASKGFAMPVGPQPEQIRLLTYAALGAGCHGLGFWSDQFLADKYQGRDRLLCVALLNKELELLEPLLVTIDGPPVWIDTKQPEVKAAVFRTAKGILVLPMWLGKGAQFVPGQSATNKLEITIPQIPHDTQAWEVSPGEVRSLKAERVTGGIKITVEDFDLTTALVFTPDTKLVVRFQEHCQTIRQLAAQWTYEQAVEEKRKVELVQKELAQLGQALPQSDKMLGEAQKKLDLSRQHWDRHMYAEAYHEAQRALRPLRIIMRQQWERAVKNLDSAVALPYAVSYYTLPAFWQMVQEIRQTKPGANVLSGGDFEDNDGQAAWRPAEVPSLDEVVQKAQRVGTETASKITPKSGKLCAMLTVAPKSPDTRIGALERTYVSVNSPAVQLPPGSLVKISAWINVPKAIQASVDGVLFFDSAAGEPLALRLTTATKSWQQFSLYRRVSASGTINVTLALSGIGTAYFDDVRIEPLLPAGKAQQ